MKHFIKDNIYYIVDENGIVLLSVELVKNNLEQIIIKTDKEVYAGPIKFLQFS